MPLIDEIWKEKLATHTYRKMKYTLHIYFVHKTIIKLLVVPLYQFYQPKNRRLFFFGIQNETDICKKQKKRSYILIFRKYTK